MFTLRTCACCALKRISVRRQCVSAKCIIVCGAPNRRALESWQYHVFSPRVQSSRPIPLKYLLRFFFRAGYNRMIRVFDVSQPGRSFEARPTCKTRKSKTGQRGIISALAFCPETSGGGLFAAGSYAKTICLYSENRWAHHLGSCRRSDLRAVFLKVEELGVRSCDCLTRRGFGRSSKVATAFAEKK